MSDDKVKLQTKRAELVTTLGRRSMLPEERARLQGELAVVNAQIKAINTTEAAKLKAAADRRKAAGLAEAQANARRAAAKVGDEDEEDDDPGQTAAIDAWIVKVLSRGGVPVIRMRDGGIGMAGVPQKWAAIIDALSAGVHAAARGQELPEIASPEPKKKRRQG